MTAKRLTFLSGGSSEYRTESKVIDLSFDSFCSVLFKDFLLAFFAILLVLLLIIQILDRLLNL
jgi:hypothetical protein